MRKDLRGITKPELIDLFQRIDAELPGSTRKIEVVVIGGAAILMQDIRARTTTDIDLAPVGDTERFLQLCIQHGIDAQVVTVTTTVDFDHVPTAVVFTGDRLLVKAVGPVDLVKLKLERFQRQDPEDIYEIIDKTGLSYEAFCASFAEMQQDFVGNPARIVMAARTVVETKFPEKAEAFRAKFPI